MKKFIHVSLCVALLGTFVVKAKDHSFAQKGVDCTVDVATAAGATTAALYLFGTKQGRDSVQQRVFTSNKEGQEKTHALLGAGTAAAVGLAEYYELHKHLKSLPVVGETLYDFVDDHKAGVATAAGIVMTFVLNSLKAE